MDTLAGLRRLIAGILLLGMSGTFVELLLLSHTEDTLQLLPLVLLGCGVAVVAWHAWSRSLPSGLLVRGVMLLFVIAGALGIFFHFEANLESSARWMRRWRAGPCTGRRSRPRCRPDWRRAS